MSKASTCSSTVVGGQLRRRGRRSLLSRLSAWFCYPSHIDPEPSDCPSNDVTIYSEDCSAAYSLFLHTFPEYRLTHALDSLRQSDYTRLQRSGEVYVDHTGATLYPEMLIRLHSAFLQQQLLGNTHSVSNSSQLSANLANQARETVLDFFGAPRQDYTVIFTANATGALKLVGESYPFDRHSSFLLCPDSHNSMNGIREYAARAGSEVVYIGSTPKGGFNTNLAQDALQTHKPPDHCNSLFAVTGASNITNSKADLSIVEYASSMGFHTLLDAAALAPTSKICLADTSVDAMAVSFYKMFGYPTGVGALVVKKSFLAKLKRPWFAGGTVDVVQVPGTIVTAASETYEQFEDGTINYTSLYAITQGLRMLSNYIPLLPLRLSCLMHYLVNSLSKLRYEHTDTPVVRIISRLPTEPKPMYVGQQSDTGSIISLVFLSPEGNMIPLSLVEHAASASHISLRCGCMCNPGGAVTILGAEKDMAMMCPGLTLNALETLVGRELGVVRISLGLSSNFEDAWRVLKFAEDVIGRVEVLRGIQDRWKLLTNGAQVSAMGSHEKEFRDDLGLVQREKY